jgi:predicted anti-sigma-YlaC factor YlaD
MLSKYKIRKMKCRTVHNLLVEYAEGTLSVSQKKQAEDHMAECENCRRYLTVLSETFDVISRETHIEPDLYMYSRILSAMKNKEQEKTRIQGLLQPLIISLSILVLVFAGIRIGKSYQYQNALASDYQSEVYYLNEVYNENIESVILTDYQQN